MIGLAIGLGVFLRRLGERLQPESSAITHLMIGLVPALCCLLLPVSWLLAFIAAAWGLGAWLRARC